ncbi:MAG: HD domain-containing protein [Planctomycetota bacterium]|nr:HD domain-containing protein [Planctomycetota bacterium]
MRNKTLRDTIHGDIELSKAEVEVVDTAPFQRMRGIKQLGTSSLVFPSATHTRFEHSLGTCWLAKKMLGALRIQSGRRELLENEEPAICMAALLHDITHIPFGHTFEDERRVFSRHDESPDRLNYFLSPPIGTLLEAAGLKDSVIAILSNDQSPDPTRKLMREVIAGTVCADLLDYLKRDAYFCGLRQDYDERIYRYLTICNGEIVFDLQQSGRFRPDALTELVHLLRLRYTLTERVYYHHGKVVSGAMISKALEITLNSGRIRQEELFDLRDDSFLYLLGERSKDDPDAMMLVNDLNAHRFYRCVYMLRPGGMGGAGVGPGVEADLEKRFHINEDNERRKLEEEIANELGVSHGEVLVYCPSAKMSLKEARVKVKVDSGSPVSLSDLRYPEVEVLLEKHRALWRFSVYLRRGREDMLQRAGRLCEELIGQRNMVSESGR